MVRNYKKKGFKKQWTDEQLEEALNYAQDGKSVLATAKMFGIPRSTLDKKIKQRDSQDVSDQNLSSTHQYQGGFKTVFSAEQENALYQYITDMESCLMGLSSKDIRVLAFQWAEMLKLKHPFSVKDGAAGTDWLKGFMERHDLSSRKAEATSSLRSKGFNKENVEEFFTLLKKLKDDHGFKDDNIYNCDETGITVNPKSSVRVIAPKGKRQVGGKVPLDRGETVSAEICMSATGKYMPPMLIFPRVKENPQFLKNKPPGSWAVFDKSGWMQNYIFTRWFKEFIKFSHASATNPVLLILDGHATHVRNIDVINLARENNVTILSLPPHCSHMMQPLDVGFMKPLSQYYSEALKAFQRKSPKVDIKDIFGLFGIAFMKAAKMETAVNSFQKCGIVPFDPSVFKEESFAAASRSSPNYNKNTSNAVEEEHVSLTKEGNGCVMNKQDYMNQDKSSSQSSLNYDCDENTSKNINEASTSTALSNVKEGSADVGKKNHVNQDQTLDHKATLHKLVQLQSEKMLGSLLNKEVDETVTNEPVIQIPLSYIIQAKPLINCLSSMLSQEESSSPMLVNSLSLPKIPLSSNNLLIETSATSNVINKKILPKTLPKKRKTGKAAVITEDSYKENLIAVASKKIKKEKKGVMENKQNKPVIKSIVDLNSNHQLSNLMQPQDPFCSITNHNGILNFEPAFMPPQTKFKLIQQQTDSVTESVTNSLSATVESVSPTAQSKAESLPVMVIDQAPPVEINNYHDIDVSSLPIIFT